MKRLPLCLLALASLGLGSCIKLDAVLTVKKDGSGTIVETVEMGGGLDELAALAGDQGKKNFVDKDKAAKRAKSLGEGVELKSLEELPGGKGAKATFTFKDVAKLSYNMDAGDAQLPKDDEPMTFAFSSGKLTIKNPIMKSAEKKAAEKKDKGADAPPVDEAALPFMKKMFGEMKVRMAVAVEGSIKKTNASHKEKSGNAITMMEMNGKEMVEDPNFLKAIQSAEADPKALKKVKGVKIEDKDEITIEF